MYSIKGQIIDLFNRTIYPGEVIIQDNRISDIRPTLDVPDQYILPGFVDAHIHIESSMVVPYEFARIAIGHGTVATVSDPHEIANVLGVEGVKYMIDNAKGANLKFHFGAPSCVPATSFETAGAIIDSEDIRQLLNLDDIYYLSEMMNYPGVLAQDSEVMKKLAYAKQSGKPIDGHAPGLRAINAKRYIEAGITTDHECYTLEEAQEKLAYGMKIIIREGSAAKNFEALHPIIGTDYRRVMFCSDDKHPDDLMINHIDELVRRALGKGYDMYDVLRIACINPVEHYGLTSGLMRVGDPADFIVVEDLQSFKVKSTYIDGLPVYEDGVCKMPQHRHEIVNQFNIDKKLPQDFKVKESNNPVPVINVIDGELITEKSFVSMTAVEGHFVSDPSQDILKIAVINRYQNASVAVGLIKNFGLKSGAIASTVAHDSHNIIVVGVSDKDLAHAVNLLVKSKGGLSAVKGEKEHQIALPIAGLMSDRPCEEVAKSYSSIDKFVKKMGCKLKSPFMTLSFMALLVIPKIKISDKGMFDAEAFEFYN